MLEFLQGASYGLFLSCLPWTLVGLINPELALPDKTAGRLQVLLRYALAAPFISMLMWLTSLWGGFGVSLVGWLAGLVAIAVEIPLERRLRHWYRGWRQRRQDIRIRRHQRQKMAQREQQRRESGLLELDPEHPPQDADEVVLAMWRAKQGLSNAGRKDLAEQVDRLYSRYRHVLTILDERFTPGELAHGRAQQLVVDVCHGAQDNLEAMIAQARGVRGMDVAYIQRRLGSEAARLSASETDALRQRMALIEQTEQSIRQLAARHEQALTALDNAAVSLSRLDTSRPRTAQSAEVACGELRRFVEGAERYRHPQR
ncbi:MAG: cobyrinic acid a,c-diamide synthase [Halomonas sp.]|uniref:cobyrinic acid a,c-diamide synthase n=1 Tax=Halomonas sp. TaxID=1486246 RepID=UPI003F9089F3